MFLLEADLHFEELSLHMVSYWEVKYGEAKNIIFCRLPRSTLKCAEECNSLNAQYSSNIISIFLIPHSEIVLDVFHASCIFTWKNG